MDQVDEVKSKVDIVDVISSYVPLKKAGRNFAGLCPFHTEKTPSFMVSAERQVFKCFGCGEGGDVFTFVEKMEGWDFREALEDLAKRVGVTLKSFKPTQGSAEREKLLEIHKLATKFYSHLLTKHKIGEGARKYLLERGIKREAWEKFGLGFATDRWSTLNDFLKSRKYSLDLVAKAGLVIARRSDASSYYDRFRNRIIFPLKDARGEIVGFSGRILTDREREAKYINSPETPIFNKGSILFGLDVARDGIRKKDEAVVVEGEFDAISAWQAKITNVVASKGTAFSEKQVSSLTRIASNVVLCFDMDVAGDAAARRSIELLDIAGANVKVAQFGKFKDPDEFIRRDSKGFGEAISGALNVYDFMLDSVASRFDRRTAEGKKSIGREAIPQLAKISDDIVRAHYIEKLARMLALDVSLVLEAVEKKANLNLPAVSAENIQSAKSVGLEEYFIALVFGADELEKWMTTLLDASHFSDKQSSKLWGIICAIIGSSKAVKKTQVLGRIPKDLSDLVDHLFLINVSPVFSDKELLAGELKKIAVRIRKNYFRGKLLEISQNLKVAQEKEDTVLVNKLSREFGKISEKLKEVN